MDATVEYSWQLVYDLGGSAIGRLVNSNYFLVRETDNYPNRISASNRKLYHPVELVPTDSFHQKARSQLRVKTGENIPQKNFPYTIKIPGFEEPFALALRFNVFLPNILTVRVSSNAKQPFEESSALWRRRLSNHPILHELCQLSATLVSQSLSLGGIKPRMIESRPMMIVRSKPSSVDFDAQSSIKLADLLIGRANYETDSTVPASIMLKNVEHNAKDGNGNLFLVDKMGWLFYHSYTSKPSEFLEKEMKKKQELYELAVAIGELYKGSIGENEYNTIGWFFMVSATAPYISHFEHTFNASFSNKMYWSILLKEFELPVGFEIAVRFSKIEFQRDTQIINKTSDHVYSSGEFWRNIVSKVAGSKEQNIANRHQPVLVLGDIYMGDDFSGSNNVAGSIGSGSHANDVRNSGNSQSMISPGSNDLRQELSLLVSALMKGADTPDKEVAVESVQKAVAALDAGKPEHAKAYLKTSGVWVLGVAEKIGVALAAALLKSVLVG